MGEQKKTMLWELIPKCAEKQELALPLVEKITPIPSPPQVVVKEWMTETKT